MKQYLPSYGEVLELKTWMKENGLPYIHFHDGCGYSWFEFDTADEKARKGVLTFWKGRGKNVSFREDGLTFIITEP